MAMQVRSDLVSALGRGAHDAGLAAMFGGALFGRLAMHPALAEVSHPAERGKVVNDAWRRYGTVNDRSLSPRERRLARAKDVAVVAVAVTGVASALEGVRFGRMAPDGAVPLIDGNEASPAAPAPAARAKRALNALGGASLVAELALIGVNAALGQANFRRPPARRVLRRRY
jgi:hypothetical protein